MKLSGFGSFGLREKGERIGRNPKTGEEVPITPRKVLVFRASNIMKERINRGLGGGQARQEAEVASGVASPHLAASALPGGGMARRGARVAPRERSGRNNSGLLPVTSPLR